MDWRAPHEELERARARCFRRKTHSSRPRRLRTRRTRHRAAVPRRRAGLSRPDPAEGQGHPAALPHHRHERPPAGHRDDGAGARGAPSGPRPPGGVLPVRHRRGVVPMLPVLRDAPPRQGGRLAGAAGVPSGRGRAGRGLGGVRAGPRRPRRHVGRAVRARLLRARRAARHAELRAVRAGPEQPGRVVGLLRRRTGERLGRRDARVLRPRAQHRRGGARFAGRRFGATPSVGSTGPTWPRCPPWWSRRCPRPTRTSTA